MALSSLATQCQAFKQPMASPTTNSASVHGCLPGWCLSSQMPRAAPSSVGTTTDQPIRPIIPKPNQTPCVELRAFSLRTAFAPTSTAKVGTLFEVMFGSSFMVQVGKPTQKSSFQFCRYQAPTFLLLVQDPKFLLHRSAQLAEVRSSDRPTYGNQHLRSGFDQHSFIHRHENFTVSFGLIDQNSRHERGDAIQSVRQETK